MILTGFVTLGYSGAYGASDSKPIDEQVSKMPSTSTFSTVSAGGEHTIAIKTDGSLYAWGDNEYGQLGDGTNDDKKVPTQIGSDNNWASVSAGGARTISVKTDGSLYAWGYNYSDQLEDCLKVPTLIFIP